MKSTQIRSLILIAISLMSFVKSIASPNSGQGLSTLTFSVTSVLGSSHRLYRLESFVPQTHGDEFWQRTTEDCRTLGRR